MKRIKFLFITFLIFVVCFGCSGCSMSCNPALLKHHKFLIKKISELTVEVDGYKLITWRELKELNSNTNPNYNTYGYFSNSQYGSLSYKINGELVKIENSELLYPTMYYKDTVIEISTQYLEETCPVYKNSHNAWTSNNTFLTSHYQNEEEFSFAEFDNKFFMITHFVTTLPLDKTKYEYPVMLYMYDFDTEHFLYAGSYLDVVEETDLVVVKSED